jgi:hypothetical protein
MGRGEAAVAEAVEAVDISDLAEGAPHLDPGEAALTEAIARLTRDLPQPAGVRVTAALVRLLVRKGYFSEAEFLEELARR